MSSQISEKVRDNLFHSRIAVEAAAPAIKAAMIPSLALAEGERAPFARASGIAATLVDMLLEQARRMADGREPGEIEAIAAGHRLLGIEGRHYSRFGDSLAPVLKDAIGPRLPSAVTAAWGDAFWFVIRRVMRASQRQQGPAGSMPEPAIRSASDARETRSLLPGEGGAQRHGRRKAGPRLSGEHQKKGRSRRTDPGSF
jgi:hypothetical protein